MINIHRHQAGVTIIELMIATSVFAVILLIVIFAFLFVSNDYIKGYVQSQTQETARAVMEQVSQDVELSTDPNPISCTLKTQIPASTSCAVPVSTTGTNYICVGDDLYTFLIGKELGTTAPHVLDLYPNASGCSGSTPPSEYTVPCAGSNPAPCLFDQALGGTELLSDHMTLGNFRIVPIGTGLYSIKLTIAYGDSSVLLGSAPNYYCPDLKVGGDFCAVSTLQTIVQQRVQ